MTQRYNHILLCLLQEKKKNILTGLFEYRSGKSHVNVAVSPVFIDTISDESSNK